MSTMGYWWPGYPLMFCMTNVFLMIEISLGVSQQSLGCLSQLWNSRTENNILLLSMKSWTSKNIAFACASAVF